MISCKITKLIETPKLTKTGLQSALLKAVLDGNNLLTIKHFQT